MAARYLAQVQLELLELTLTGVPFSKQHGTAYLEKQKLVLSKVKDSGGPNWSQNTYPPNPEKKHPYP